MIYLIESDDYIIIQSKINEILSTNSLSMENIIKYNLLETPISILLEDLNTFNLLVDRKVVIGENANFLTSSKVKIIDHDMLELERYINNVNVDNILILVCSKVDNKKKIVKLIKDKGIFISGELSINDLVRSNLDDYKMDDRVINYLIGYCANDNEKILNELEKLKCYKVNEKEITISDIDEIVMKTLDDNIFDFINAVISKNRNKAYNIYQDLLSKGEEVTKLVIMVADQIRLIFNCKNLLFDGYNREEITSYLECHPYKVKLAIESSYSYDKKELLSLLNKLYEVDYSIKTGKVIGSMAFDLLILNL